MSKNQQQFPALFERCSSLSGVISFYAGYGILHAVITRTAGPALALDDVKLNIVTQSLEGGYMLENPPLFEWLLVAVQTAAGPTLASFLIVKYALLIAAGAFTYLAAKEMFSDRKWAAAAALSLLAFFQIGWNYHQAFTHTTALIATTSFFWSTVFRLFRIRNLTDYCLLGAAVGVGLLSKYSFVGVLGATCIALSTRANGREILFNWRTGVALIICAVLVFPHASWLLAENAGVAQRAEIHLQGDENPHWRRAADGLIAALWSGASFFLPFILIAGFFFPAAVRSPRTANALSLVAKDAAIVGFTGIAAAIILFGMSNIQERYFIAFLYPMLFWLMAAIKESGASDSASRRFIGANIGLLMLIAALRLVQTGVAGPPFCSNCRQWIPYSALGEALADLDYKGGTLVGFEDHTAGNLRRLFPDERVISSHMPFYTAPGGAMSDPCLFVWSDDLGPPIPDRVRKALDNRTMTEVKAEWRHPFKSEGWRTTTWTIAGLDHDAGLETEICRIHN